MKISDTRRRRLEEWCSTNQVPPSEKSYFSQLLTGKGSFGERAARRIEQDYGMPVGFLDRGYSEGAAAQEIGKRLTEAMTKAGYTSEVELERASGVPQSTINRIRTGFLKNGPALKTLRALSAACNVPFEWLSEGEGVAAPAKALTPLQLEWIGLLDSLGSDDIEEFISLIKSRQERNRRLLAELGKRGAGN